ncbi:MFS transporter [Hymenobacter terrenus]|uniref:MFS transporter n=1 Tax=Hymenobacter terrenus TaxID=1629124 RepID=UPI000619FA70|nr:MFS transporter [Hymenobacter terrenus]
MAPVRHPYLFLFFFTLLNVLGFADRSLLAGFSLQIISELKMSYAQFSFLSGVAFIFFNSGSLLAMGHLADRVHRPRLIAVGMLLWSLMTAFSGLARGFGMLAFTRGMVGVGEASLAPSSLGMLSDVFPERRRGFVLGLYFVGTPVGVAVSYFIAAVLGPKLGWRNCFLGLGALGVVFSLVLPFLRDPRPAATTATTDGLPADAGLRVLLVILRRSVPLQLLLLGGILINFSIGATVLDLVWLVKEKGFLEKEAQGIAGSFFLVGGIMGTWLGGVGGDWFSQRFPGGGRALFLAVVYAFLAPMSVVLRVMPPTHILFYPFVFVGCINIMLASGVPIAAATELVPERIRSSVIALSIVATSVFGYSSGSYLVGVLSDYFTRLGYASPISWADLWITVAALPAVACFYLCYRKQQPQLQPAPLVAQAQAG